MGRFDRGADMSWCLSIACRSSCLGPCCWKCPAVNCGASDWRGRTCCSTCSGSIPSRHATGKCCGAGPAPRQMGFGTKLGVGQVPLLQHEVMAVIVPTTSPTSAGAQSSTLDEAAVRATALVAGQYVVLHALAQVERNSRSGTIAVLQPDGLRYQVRLTTTGLLPLLSQT